MESDGETATEGGDRATSVRLDLSGGGLGSLTFGDKDLGFVVLDVPEARCCTRGITKADNGIEVSPAEGRDLATNAF